MAYVLQALAIPLVRLYEGYDWPRGLNWLQRWAEEGQRRAKQAEKSNTQANEASRQRTLFFGFPRDDRLVLATRLGNTLRAAEEYPYYLYQMDAIIWWPRLVTLLPDAFRAQVDGAFTPVVALLNLCTLFGLWALGGGAMIALTDHRRWLFALVLGGGVWLGWVCYQAAITQAEDYGNLVRVAFDLHRHALLEKLHITRPDNLAAERILWYKLGQFHYHYSFPGEVPLPAVDLQPLRDPFYYDNHKQPQPPQRQTIELQVKGLSASMLRRRRGQK
jgi:hypothetical protein